MTVRYSVLRFGDHWSILRDTARAGEFAEQVDAIEVARRLAHEEELTGAVVELLVQDHCGEVREAPVVVN
jgi:hypothetical protein